MIQFLIIVALMLGLFLIHYDITKYDEPEVNDRKTIITTIIYVTIFVFICIQFIDLLFEMLQS